MRQQRKRREWVDNVAMYAIGFLAIITGLPAAVYVHENARQWEAPAVFISLGLGILPALWYWRVRRHGRVVSIISAVFLAISFGTALVHGWEVQAEALVTVAMVALAVVMFVDLARATRSVETAMRAAGEEINGDPLFRRDALFRDDGQRITVYPRRRRLILSCAVLMVILAGIACVFAFLRPDDLQAWTGLGISACLLVTFVSVMLYRLVIRRPSLVVGPDGILDNGSIIWSGVGLIRWDEILMVFPSTISSSG